MKELEPFERRVEILKLLQGREMRTREIAEHFGVEERTIRADVDVLRKGMDLLGMKIKIESKHPGKQQHYYKSTVHPIVLALNLSELFSLLKLLENAMLQSRGEIYRHIFELVYSQITDYAEGYIADKLKNKYHKTEISNLLEEEAIRHHQNILLVYWQKSGRYIEIRYRNQEGVLVTEEVSLVDIRGDDEMIVRNKQGDEFSIDYNDVMIDWSSADYQ